MKETRKVKCIVCLNEKDSFCSIKRCKLKLNKSRCCDSFIDDVTKHGATIKPEVTLRPDWYWNRKKAIKDFKAAELKKRLAELECVAETPSYLQKEELTKPDVLSRFRSTASQE